MSGDGLAVDLTYLLVTGQICAVGEVEIGTHSGDIGRLVEYVVTDFPHAIAVSQVTFIVINKAFNATGFEHYLFDFITVSIIRIGVTSRR